MAPISKESEVITAPPATATSVPSGVGTETSNKPLPVALEVPVTVNGARTVEGSDKREPFSETTKTVLVFANGAVIRLTSPVTAGQLLFLTNEKTKKEVVCQVVKSKNYRNVSGYVELEFTESVVGFWGMRFPTDRVGGQTPVPAPPAVIASGVTSVAPAAVPVVPKVVIPVVSAVPKLPGVKPVPTQAEANAGPLPPRPVEVKTILPTAPGSEIAATQVPISPAVPVEKRPEAPAIAPTPISSSLASSLATLLSAPETAAALPASKPLAPPVAIDIKQEPARVAGDNSSDELKLQAARLQEQLSSMLFSSAPSDKPAAPAPVVPALDLKVVSTVAASVLEIAKTDSAPVKSAPVAKNPAPPSKSGLDSEEVKIPSWLEPLARNAAVPASNQEHLEREKAKHNAENSPREDRPAELLPAAAEQSIPESHLPTFGSLLPLDEEVPAHKRESGGSRKGVLLGTIAAAVLLAAGGAWYFLRPANSAQGTAQPVASAVNAQTTAGSPGSSANQAVLENSATAPQSTPSSSPATPAFNAPAVGAPGSKPSVNPEPVPVTRDNTRGSGTTIPAAVTEKISRPAPEQEPEPKKPVLGEVHLASPTMNRPAGGQDDGVAAPAISASDADTNAPTLETGLAAGGLKQPAAPEAPLPSGGDVKSATLLSKVNPVYPSLAKNQHVSGNVVIDALIDANGRVSSVKVVSGPALLQQSAMDALKQWKYQPATLDGKPVSMHLMVTLQFRND
jgi:TonB family protein